MVIKVYLSSMSGNMEIKKHQDSVIQILQSHKVEFERIDITDPSNEEEKQFMRANSVPKEGAKVPLPPQIFNDTQYCGDFNALDDANECDEVLSFLKLADPKPAFTPSEQTEPIIETSQPQINQSPIESSTSEHDTDTVVSTLTLGSLTTKSVDDKASSDNEDKDSIDGQDQAAAGFAYRPMGEAADRDSDEAPPIVEREARKQQRKSREMNDYENIEFKPKANGSKVEDDVDSLNDSIEDTEQRKNGDGGEAVEESSEP